jgi:hypothetical protein
MFVLGMLVVVKQDMHQGLRRVNDARNEAVGVVLDKAFRALGLMLIQSSTSGRPRGSW